MRTMPRIAQLALAALAGALLAGGGYALAASHGSRTIHGCVVRHSHELLIQRRCRRGQAGARRGRGAEAVGHRVRRA
ncbi:MAG: hypothetical protein ACRDLV_02550, partial [Solirubrobacteraceae bacterium]